VLLDPIYSHDIFNKFFKTINFSITYVVDLTGKNNDDNDIENEIVPPWTCMIW
jgi:hypothetical protein